MQRNILTGQIPSSIGNLTKLNLLDISNNRLQRAIPLSLGNCQQLNQLDVSANKLTGEIPGEVFRLSSLSVALNLSRNLFNGSLGVEIGNLTNLEVLDVSYNNLSGSIPDVIVSLQGMESLDLSMKNFTGRIRTLKVSYKDLHQATNGFSSDNLIGSGGFGTIYKGVLDQVANPVAVKVLNIHEKKAYKCLLAECNALKCARHRNLVRILT
ncbi:Receptor kinase-like protein Xa21 [Linum perenne]